VNPSSASMRILAAEPPGVEKPPILPPAAKTLAGDDQRHRILRHGLANIARGFRSGPEFLRQSAISGRAAPSDVAPRHNTLEERVRSPRSSLNLENPSPCPRNSALQRRPPRPPPAWARPVWRRAPGGATFVGPLRRFFPATGSA
jgi:hypothetical protein